MTLALRAGPRTPPGPRGGVLRGTSPQWRDDPLRYMTQLVREYGPAVRFHYVLGRYGFVLTHPDHYQRILQDNQRNYTKRHPVYDVLGVALGRSLVTLDGDTWRAHRRLMQPAFHRARMEAIGRLVIGQTDAMLERWDRLQMPGTGPREIPLDREMMALTLAVVGDALFGTPLADHTRTVDDAFTSFSANLLEVITRPLALLTARRPIVPSTRRLHMSARRLRSVVDEIIAARQTESAPTGNDRDLLGMLLGARDETTGARLSATDVRDEVMTIMLAGHETSATALTWTFYLLGEHPTVEGAVREEVAGALGSRTPATSDLPALPLTRAVIEEAMRLYPPIYAFDRRAEEPDRVGGYDIPAGALVSLCPFVTHRMPEFWEAPERFMPQRFLPGAPNAPHRFSYLPFSSGPRQCIGAGFAMTEMVLVLARVLQRYRLRLPPATVVEPSPGITLRPRHGLPMLAMPIRL